MIDLPMKRYLVSVTLQLLLGLATGPWFPAVAKNLPPSESALTLVLRVHDDAGADPEILASAMDRVNAVYADAGVSTQWAHVDRLAGKAEYGIPTLDVSIVGGDAAKYLATTMAGHERVMGQAAMSVDRAYVFYDRIIDAAVTMKRFPGNFLGDVIAHEIGHLLLPGTRHSERGIMRANVPLNERLQTFNDDQSQFVRSTIKGLSREPIPPAPQHLEPINSA